MASSASGSGSSESRADGLGCSLQVMFLADIFMAGVWWWRRRRSEGVDTESRRVRRQAKAPQSAGAAGPGSTVGRTLAVAWAVAGTRWEIVRDSRKDGNNPHAPRRCQHPFCRSSSAPTSGAPDMRDSLPLTLGVSISGSFWVVGVGTESMASQNKCGGGANKCIAIVRHQGAPCVQMKWVLRTPRA